MSTIDLVRRWSPWIALAAVALALMLAGPAACKRAQRFAAELRVSKEQQQSAAASARDAIATTGSAAARENSSNDLTTTNQREIRNAEGADAAVDPRAGGAGLDGLCRLAAYRDSERCRLRRAAAR